MKRLVLAFTFLAAILAAVAGQGWLVQNSTAQGAPTPGTATYKYDSLGQVVQDVYPANSGAYSYDAAGNRLTETRN
jgi:YD repeat-containing protein